MTTQELPSTPEAPTRTAILVEPNLLTASKLLNGLKTLGFTVVHLRSLDGLGKGKSAPVELLIGSYEALRSSTSLSLEAAKSVLGTPRILAYAPHVKIPSVRAEALRSGIDRLCANSAITLRLQDNVDRVFRITKAEVDENEPDSHETKTVHV